MGFPSLDRTLEEKQRNEDISSIPDIDQRRPEAEQNAYLTSVVALQLLLGEEADGSSGRLGYQVNILGDGRRNNNEQNKTCRRCHGAVVVCASLTLDPLPVTLIPPPSSCCIRSFRKLWLFWFETVNKLVEQDRFIFPK